MSNIIQRSYTQAVAPVSDLAAQSIPGLPGGIGRAILVTINTAGLNVRLLDDTTVSLSNPTIGRLIPITFKGISFGVANSILALA